MIDVDEVYTLEVNTLSTEDQHQIKRQKKALKRNRNRLNRVKRIMERASSNEIDLTEGKKESSVALIRRNAPQEQFQYETTKLQYTHDATIEKLTYPSGKDGDIKIELDASLPEVLATTPVSSENQNQETIDRMSNISDDHDVKFTEIEETLGGTTFPKNFNCSANPVTDHGSFTKKEVHKPQVLLSHARGKSACPYKYKAVDHDHNSDRKGSQPFPLNFEF